MEFGRRCFAVGVGIWLTLVVSMLAMIVLGMLRCSNWWITSYLAATTLASPLCFAAYGFDKRRAIQERNRIPERTLHLLAIAGGWPGAVLGQRTFRHKTQKISFRLVLGLIIALHLGLVACGLHFWLRVGQ